MSYNQGNDSYINMDGTGSMNPVGSFQPAQLQGLTPEQLYQLQLINQQQIQQLTEQMNMMQVVGGGANPALLQQTTSPTSPVGPPFYNPTGPGQSPVSQNFVSPTGHLYQPISTAAGNYVQPHAYTTINGNFPAIQVTSPNQQSHVAYPNTHVGINGQLHNQINVQGLNGGVVPNATARNISAPSHLPLNHTTAQRPVSSQSGSSFGSSSASTPHDSPATPKKSAVQSGGTVEGPAIMGRPRQQLSSPPSIPPPATSDRSSTSSASIPGSPLSAGTSQPDGYWSDASGPRSPDSARSGDARSGVSIQNKPLQMQTRYPQDKCYSCMKKVYPMEKIGPVRGVVYHKGCFRCKICQTQLTLKNFFHSQCDSYDLSVYCKSHQPLSTDKGPKLDAESFEIKSALKAPKAKAITPESERSPINKYSYDAQSRAIEHARKVPVAELQSGNKLRTNAWSKSKRDRDNVPVTTEVVRHDSPVPEYDPESYERHQVETTPDYT